MKPGDISLFVPHQANIRIIESVNEKVGLTMDQTAVVLDRTGNTSAASIPFALAEAADAAGSTRATWSCCRDSARE